MFQFDYYKPLVIFLCCCVPSVVEGTQSFCSAQTLTQTVQSFLKSHFELSLLKSHSAKVGVLSPAE